MQTTEPTEPPSHGAELVKVAPKVISGEIITQKVIIFVKAESRSSKQSNPEAAEAVRAEPAENVVVSIDENSVVVSASAIIG